MLKRGRRLILKSASFSEIFLLISFSFAVAFIFSETKLASSQTPVATEAFNLLPGEVLKGGAWSAGQGGSFFLNPTTKVVTDGAGKFAGYLGSDNLVTQTAPTTTTPGGIGIEGHIGNLFGGTVFEGTFAPGTTLTPTQGLGVAGGAIFAGLAWAGVAFAAIQLIGGFLGLDNELTNALSYAAAGGAFVGAGTGLGLTNAGLTSAELGGFSPTVIGIGGGLIFAIAIFVLTYSKETKKLVTFECLPFEPPLGGAKCEECNKDPFRPCSEYRCRSLGQACQLLNPGTAEEQCSWVNPGDVNSPTIQPSEDALKPNNLKYIPDNAIRPPNRGVKIVSDKADGCLPAFTKLEFGFNLNEPAQCKIDYNHTSSFDEMLYFVGGSNFHRYNHTQIMKLPGPDDGTGEAVPELKNDGFFSLFVRCRDANGNENVDEFVFNFCVDPSEDTTPPIVEGTSIANGGFVRFEAKETPIEVYTNEPSECKWSKQSKSFDDMENSMICATETFQINDNLNYVCAGNLTGLTDRADNKFYFRCKDQPNKPENKRNVMVQSYELVLKGSQPLNIVNVAPNGTVSGSSSSVPVTLFIRTDDGAEEGTSICYFSRTGEQDSYIPMFDTANFEHRQELDLLPGEYEYFFRCIDRGGNTDEETIEFEVFADQGGPIVTRAYRDGALKIITNEDALCVYSLTSCNYEFDAGLKMENINPSLRKSHFVEWKAGSKYYIKCRDDFNNEPGPNDCSIIVNTV